MALQIQNVALVEDYVPFERPPQNITLWSAIPRGVVSFFAAGVALDTKTINNDMLLNLNATLPPNYGYVFMDANLTIAQSTSNAWNTGCNLNLQNFYRANGSSAIGLTGNWFQDMQSSDPATQFEQVSMRVTQDWPAFPMIGVPGSSGILAVHSAGNPLDPATSGGTVNYYSSWWQFDLEQIRKFPINSPIPTHAR